jgi:hypothetical protein
MRNRLRPCVCRVVRTQAMDLLGIEMITYSWLCKRGAHAWYARQGGALRRHDYRPIP